MDFMGGLGPGGGQEEEKEKIIPAGFLIPTRGSMGFSSLWIGGTLI